MTRRTPANTTAKKQIARLIDQHDAVATRYADAILRGQMGLATKREQALRRLAIQIRNAACRHDLITWTRSRLAGK